MSDVKRYSFLSEEFEGRDEFVLAADYDTLAQRLAAVEQELQAIRDTVGDEDFYLRQENARLREEVLTARNLADLSTAIIDDLKQQLAAAQGTWTKERPTEAGWYWWRHKDTCLVVQVEHNPDFDDLVYREGRDTYGLDDFLGGEWCRISEPREQDGKEGRPHAPR